MSSGAIAIAVATAGFLMTGQQVEHQAQVVLGEQEE
eukprot:gene34253-41463_t